MFQDSACQRKQIEDKAVAAINRKDWLGPDDSIVDLEQVRERLNYYEKFINECVKITDKNYEED